MKTKTTLLLLLLALPALLRQPVAAQEAPPAAPARTLGDVIAQALAHSAAGQQAR